MPNLSERISIHDALKWVSANDPSGYNRAVAAQLVRLLEADPDEVASIIVQAKNAGLSEEQRRDAIMALFAKAMED